MFIKRVKISGFKAYGETTDFGEFSSKKNCIYGLNGSGKSSFFSAIEFVLLDEFSHLRPTDRQSLLYSGKTLLTTPAAYVEIVFDNSSQRLPIKDNEVSVRRSIGINKDEYFIQRKHSTRQDLVNLFDSANYSIGTGLFSVRQGRVKTIAEMTDADRIELIYEVSGMHSYDEQRRESISMLAQAEKRREQISEAIIEIDQKLAQIQQEKQELEEYEKIMRVKHALEYIVYENDRSKVERKIEENETNIKNESSVVNNLQVEKDEIAKNRTSLESDLKTLNNQIQQNEQENSLLEQKRQDLIRKKARSDCALEKLKQKMKNAEIDLDQLQKINDKYTEKFNDLKKKREICKNECETLNNQKIRLETILNYNQSLEESYDNIAQIDQQIQTFSEKIESFKTSNQTKRENLETKISKAEAFISQKTEEKNKAIEEDKRIQEDRIKYNNEQKKLFKTQFGLQKNKQYQELAYQKAISDYEHMMGETAEAIKYIKEHYSEKDGFYGQLIDLIEFDEKFNAAVDSAAGRNLFSVVIENDSLALRILNDLKQNNIYGQVNFFLLNRIRGKKANIEKTLNSEPLIDLITFDDKVKNVVEFIFGSIALCSSIEIAAEIANTKNYTCVTLLGDTCYYSGVMTGGYISTKRSITTAKHKIELMNKPLQKTILSLDEVNSNISEVKNKLESIEKEINMNEKQIPNINTEIIKAQSKFSEYQKEIEQIDNDFQNLQTKLNDLQDQKKTLEETVEIQKKEASSLSDNDSTNRENDKKQLCEVVSELAKKKLELQQINCDYNELSKKINSTTKEINELQSEKLKELKEKMEKETKEIQESIDSFEQESSENENTRNQLQENFEDLNKKLNAIRKSEKDCKKKLNYEANRLEELNRSKTILSSKRDEIIKSIANIGFLPSDEIEQHKNLPISQILENLDDVNSQLQSFKFVNKKAIEQFKQFEKQGIDLKARQEDIDKSIEPIKKLIIQLDKNKEKAVTRTCSLVSDNFTKIYKKLDPTRNANLILTTQDDANEIGGADFSPSEGEFSNKSENESDSNSEDGNGKNNIFSDFDYEKEKRRRSKVLNLTGMSIAVNGEKIDALSGGEKTLVAIALLFALQQTEANPFYLLDEIDSDLDVNAREALAKMIDEMADDVNMFKQVQFIYTTHRGELMQHADKFFAVKHTGAGSIVQETNYEDAASFIGDVRDDDKNNV